MYAHSIIAISALCLALVQSQCDDLDDGGYSSYREACLDTAGCEWDSSALEGYCGVLDGYNDAECCEDVTTTESPTPAPTCPDMSSGRVQCRFLDEDCCDAASACTYSTSDICQTEGGVNCCKDATDEPTTASPTTDSPTTDSPTTASPTTASPTSASPTSASPTSASPTTPSPTTREPTEEPTTRDPTSAAPTTREPTEEPTTRDPTSAAPTTPAPVTPAPVTPAPVTPAPVTPAPVTPAPVTPEPTERPATSSTTDGPIPTPSPTLPSAQKWSMLHPQYKGSDGELMWQVYYGDFADDARFDDFRKQQLWDADVIRPIIDEDATFERYQAVAVAAESETSMVAQQAYLWAALASVAVIGAMVWYGCVVREGEYKKVADTETKSLLDGTRNNLVYSN